MFKSHIAVVHLEPLDGELAVASHWVVDEQLEQFKDIALVLVVVAFLALAYAAEIWPITLSILIFAIGSIAYIAYIAYCRGWWPFGIRRKNKKAVDPPDNGPGSLH